MSVEYRRELPASKEWCDKNKKLFNYLSEGLRMINLMIYIRYREATPYLKARYNLEPLCDPWFGVAINQMVTGSTRTHLDFGIRGIIMSFLGDDITEEDWCYGNWK
jgi:hypothetical protein